MRGWWIPVVVVLAGCSNDDNGTGPGVPPDTPASLSSTSLDGAIALTWSDNSFQSDPGLFSNYRVYSTRTISTTTSVARTGTSRARQWRPSSSWAPSPTASPGAFT